MCQFKREQKILVKIMAEEKGFYRIEFKNPETCVDA